MYVDCNLHRHPHRHTDIMTNQLASLNQLSETFVVRFQVGGVT